MALTRKFLSAMGIEGEKIDEIINAHAETVDALKGERDEAKREAANFKADAEKLPNVQKELDELKNAQGANPFETKYNEIKEEKETLQAEFDQYKKDIEAGEAKRTKEAVYRKLLAESGVSEKWIDKIMRFADLDGYELTNDGKFKDIETVKKGIADEYGDYIVKEGQAGATVPTPAGVNPGVPKGESRAAKIAAQYHANLYGEAKEGK